MATDCPGLQTAQAVGLVSCHLLQICLLQLHHTLHSITHAAEVAAFLSRLVAWGQTKANLWHLVGSCTGWAMCPSLQLRSQEGMAPARGVMHCAAPAGCNGTDGSNVAGGSPCSAATAAAAFASDSCLSSQPGSKGAPVQLTAAAALQRPRPPLPPRHTPPVEPVGAETAAAAAAAAGAGAVGAAAEQQSSPPRAAQ